MKALFDFFPLLLFFASFKLYGIYVATAVGIIASFGQVGFHYWRQRRFETPHVVTLVVITVFGGLTLVLQDPTFIKWKPTIVNWIFTVVLIGTHYVGHRTALQHLLGSQLSLPPAVWRKVNMSWAIFFFLLGLLNLYVAFGFMTHLPEQTRTEYWVNFKVFGMLILTLLFAFVQMAFIYKHLRTDEAENGGS
jgi:intracellular septation protein